MADKISTIGAGSKTGTYYTYTSAETGKDYTLNVQGVSHIMEREPSKFIHKHKCVVIGKKVNNGKKVEIDMVNLSICKALNNGHIELLEHADIRNDDTIYLVAHGEPYKRTLDSRSVDEVARLLVKAGYTKDKQIIVTACSMTFTPYGRANSLMQMLFNSLKQALKESGDTSGLTTSNFYRSIKCYGTGKTILLNSDNCEPTMFVISPLYTDKIKKALLFQKELTICKRLTVRVDNSSDVDFFKVISDSGKKLDIMERFKYGLLNYFYRDKSLFEAVDFELFKVHRNCFRLKAGLFLSSLLLILFSLSQLQ